MTFLLYVIKTLSSILKIIEKFINNGLNHFKKKLKSNLILFKVKTWYKLFLCRIKWYYPFWILFTIMDIETCISSVTKDLNKILENRPLFQV